MEPEYLTVEQVAEKLQLHVRTVRRMLTAGEIPGRKMGPKTWRIPAAELRDFMTTSSKTAERPAEPKGE